MKRARVELEPVTRSNQLLLRRQRARHLLERHYVDVEHRRVATLRADFTASVEARAAAEWKHSEAEAANSNSDAAATAALALVSASDVAESAEAAVVAAEKEFGLHHAKARAVVNKQVRERAALVYHLGQNLKDIRAESLAYSSSAVFEREDGEEEAKVAAPPKPPGLGAHAQTAAGAGVPVTYTSGGTLACTHCGSSTDKNTSVECMECHGAFCGVGGRGLEQPSGIPCIELYSCACKARVCHECYMGGLQRRQTQWRKCEVCEGWMCSKETASRDARCTACRLDPICRSCRGAHDKSCTFKKERREAGVEESESEEGSD